MPTPASTGASKAKRPKTTADDTTGSLGAYSCSRRPLRRRVVFLPAAAGSSDLPSPSAGFFVVANIVESSVFLFPSSSFPPPLVDLRRVAGGIAAMEEVAPSDGLPQTLLFLFLFCVGHRAPRSLPSAHLPTIGIFDS